LSIKKVNCYWTVINSNNKKKLLLLIAITEKFIVINNNNNKFSPLAMVYNKKLNNGISTWDFAHRQVYLWIECPENFSSIECILLEILKSKKPFISHKRVNPNLVEKKISKDKNIEK
jgi:hypothetical protein